MSNPEHVCHGSQAPRPGACLCGISAVAAALNLKPRSVRIVHGRRSRHKLLEVSGVDEEATALTLAQLRSSV